MDLEDPLSRQGGKSVAAFRTITEVACDLDLPQHVLRFWETKFPQLKPLKRRGGRRYYRPEDIALLRKIRALLYEDGYTIKGAQKLLRDRGVKAVDSPEDEGAAGVDDADSVPSVPATRRLRAEVEAVVGELEALRHLLCSHEN